MLLSRRPGYIIWLPQLLALFCAQHKRRPVYVYVKRKGAAQSLAEQGVI